MPLLPAPSEHVLTLSYNNKQTKIKMATLPTSYENEKQSERYIFFLKKKTNPYEGSLLHDFDAFS